jgi:hypothetical protein
MTDEQQKQIDALIEAGDEKFGIDYPEGVELTDEEASSATFAYMDFIKKAANARSAIKALRDENKALRDALEKQNQKGINP